VPFGLRVQAAAGFPDVPSTASYREAVEQLAARGIMRGYDDGRFGPHDQLLRGQGAVTITRWLGWPPAASGAQFPDRGAVDGEIWSAVLTMASQGVARGFTDGTFRPTLTMTRQEALSFIARSMRVEGAWQERDATVYADVAPAHRADVATYIAYVGPIPGGDPGIAGGRLDAAAPAERGWFAEVLWLAVRQHGGAPGATPPPAPTPGTPSGTHWRPAVGTTWQWQLTSALDLGVPAQMYDVDLFDTSAASVATLHGQGRRAICYINAGAWENWRPDSGSFPSAVQGRALDGWAGERWLDIRRIDLLAPIMRARLDQCKAKGFDGVEPDNIDGWTNATGFPLTAADQLAYNRWLADEAHERGLAIGLKNDAGQVRELVGAFDFAVVEECFQYGECDEYSPFIAAGKPVFVAEYGLSAAQICPQAASLRFSVIRKTLDLTSWRESCS
jgi:endo-alpha-1,4-polygalactosaminidase (GH114 family)